MLKTQQTTESWTSENDVESPSMQTESPPPLRAKNRVQASSDAQVDEKQSRKQRFAPNATKRKSKLGRGKTSTTTAPPAPPEAARRTPTSVQTSCTAPLIVSDPAPEPQQEGTAAPQPSRIAASPTGPANTVNNLATREKVAPANEPIRASQVQRKGSATSDATTSKTPTQAQTPPEQRQPTTEEQVAQRAYLVKTSVFARAMASTIELDATFDTHVFRAYLEQLQIEAGNATDPVERMMIEQLAMAHLRIGDLFQHAAHATGSELIKITNAATMRAFSEFRKTALALAAYRDRLRQSTRKAGTPSKKPKATR